ncbi:MAG: hypothetical protein ABH952_03240 [Candidatus Omnitrophota bacterium]
MPFFRSCLQLFLGRAGGFLIHACAVVRNNNAYIFAGPGGSGKSTVSRLSEKLDVLADDFVCIKKCENSFRAYGTPWYSNAAAKCAEIKKIFFLRQDTITRFKKLTHGEAATEILLNTYNNTFDKDIIGNMLGIIAGLTAKIPGYIMHFSLQEPLWDAIDTLESKGQRGKG